MGSLCRARISVALFSVLLAGSFGLIIARPEWMVNNSLVVGVVDIILLVWSGLWVLSSLGELENGGQDELAD